VDGSNDFERTAPVPFSVVCFRARETDEFNAALLERLNASGEVFLSHTKLGGRYTLRLAVGNLHTTERHVARAWELIQQLAAGLKETSSAPSS
jgi:aromatic-L-amino-acid/L-tryptophan decarboxylase